MIGLHNMSKKTPENIAKVRGLNIVMIGEFTPTHSSSN